MIVFVLLEMTQIFHSVVTNHLQTDLFSGWGTPLVQFSPSSLSSSPHLVVHSWSHCLVLFWQAQTDLFIYLWCSTLLNNLTDNRVVTRFMRSGIKAPGSGITTLGIGISSVLVESGIKIVNVFGIRDQNSQCFCDQGLKFSTFLWSGIKIWGKNTGSVMKKYTLLRPWDKHPSQKNNNKNNKETIGFLSSDV